MFNALVCFFYFDLRDMSDEVWVSALLSLLLIEWRLCIDGVFEIKDQTQVLNIPVKVPLVGGRYAELTGWNGSKRVDLKFWETDTIPTK
jgi:hypothetical protein